MNYLKKNKKHRKHGLSPPKSSYESLVIVPNLVLLTESEQHLKSVGHATEASACQEASKLARILALTT